MAQGYCWEECPMIGNSIFCVTIQRTFNMRPERNNSFRPFSANNGILHFQGASPPAIRFRPFWAMFGNIPSSTLNSHKK